MTDRFFNELKQSSKNKPSFQYLENGEWKVCNDLSLLPYGNTTLGKYLNGMDVFYNVKIKELQDKIDKQDKIINELISAIKTLNGGA